MTEYRVREERSQFACSFVALRFHLSFYIIHGCHSVDQLYAVSILELQSGNAYSSSGLILKGSRPGKQYNTPDQETKKSRSRSSEGYLTSETTALRPVLFSQLYRPPSSLWNISPHSPCSALVQPAAKPQLSLHPPCHSSFNPQAFDPIRPSLF